MFVRHVISLMTGTLIGQIAPVLLSPVITRLYSPDALGNFTLFMSISAIVGIVASGRYEYGILVPDEDEEAENILYFGIFISFFVSTLAIVILTIIIAHVSDKSIIYLIFFIPVSVFLIALNNIFTFHRTRNKKYSLISLSKGIPPSIMMSIQILIGIFHSSSFILILGRVISQLTSSAILLYKFVYNNIFTSDKLKAIIQAGKRYKDFPKYSMTGIMFNTFTIDAINVYIAFYYGSTILGLYSIVYRALLLPIRILGYSIGQVLMKVYSDSSYDKEKKITIIDRVLFALIIISIFITIILLWKAEFLFGVIFGLEWQKAGIFAKIVTPLFITRLVSTPLLGLLNIMEKQINLMFLQIIQGLVVITIILINFIYSYEFTIFLIIYSIALSITYVYGIIYVRTIARKLN